MKNKNKKPGKFPYALLVGAALLTANFVIGYSIEQTFISEVPANSPLGIQCPPTCGAPPLTSSEFAVIFAIITIIIVILLVLHNLRVPGTKSNNMDADR